MKISISRLIRCIALLFVFFISLSSYAQEDNIVTGRVFPAGMQTPMRDVTIRVLDNDSLYTFTDNSGKFSIIAPEFPVYLVFTKETYKAQTVKVKKPVDIVVYMIVGKG